MHGPLSRRQFLGRTAASAVGASLALGGGALLAGCASTGGASRPTVVTQGRLRHAAIGCGGMGASDLAEISKHPQVDVVALCDVDEANLEAAAQKHPGARRYRDWRELFVKEEGWLDSVHVTVPDHMHASILVTALRAGLHVYGQKPLTRTVHESRVVLAEARKAGTVTQMGIQNRSAPYYRQAEALLRSGRIGKVYEVHVWTDRPAGWWPQGVGRPDGEDPVPETLDWNLWLGVAPARPYVKDKYHPFSWRGWKDFGTGAQGDMACHLMDPALWFLELGAPLTVRSDGPVPNDETYPLWSRVRYEFPATAWTAGAPLRLTWHDGGRMPLTELEEAGAGEEPTKNAALFLGEHGALLADPYGPPKLLPEERFEGLELPQLEPIDHWGQYVDACLGRGATTAHFEYASLLSQVALLGNVALHQPHQTLRWNDSAGRFRDSDGANALLRPTYRDGWSVEGLG